MFQYLYFLHILQNLYYVISFPERNYELENIFLPKVTSCK